MGGLKMHLTTISSRLFLYDTNSWELKKSYGCYEGILRDISWSDDSKYLLQVNCKGLVEILSASENEVRSLQHIPLKDTWSASFHRDGHRDIAIGTKSGNVLIWDAKNKTVTKTFPTPLHQSSVNIVSFNAKNTTLAATMHNGDTIIYGLVSNIPVLTVKLPYSKNITAMKFHHESRSMLGLATEEGHVVLRDLTTNKDKAFFKNVHASPVSDFVYSLVNKDVMLSSGYDKIMHVYDVRLQNVVSTLRTAFPLTALAINNENQVALGTKNGTVLVYDLRDLANPLKVLKGHDEEVRRVVFQPPRKKMCSTELSLREDNATSPVKSRSPVKGKRNSDMFYVTDTPPKLQLETSSPRDNQDDSFLALMDLDKSNIVKEDGNNSHETAKKGDLFDRYNHIEAEKDIVIASTPSVQNNNEENFNSSNNTSVPVNGFDNKDGNFNFISPVCATNGLPDDYARPNYADTKQLKAPLSSGDIQRKAIEVEDLKDFIKLNIADVSDDSRNYFLHIMMLLTKQKLFMEKQLNTLTEQMSSIVQNQNMLIETNRKLLLEINQLKAQKK